MSFIDSPVLVLIYILVKEEPVIFWSACATLFRIAGALKTLTNFVQLDLKIVGHRKGD